MNYLMDAPGADQITESIIEHGVKAAGYNRAPSRDLIDRLKGGGVVCVGKKGLVERGQLGDADPVLARHGV